MLVGSWTAFESLVADLWVTCLNLRPRLGVVALDAEASPEDDEATRNRKQKTKYSFPVRLLLKWNFDLSDRMGTLLQGKWDLRVETRQLTRTLRHSKKTVHYRISSLIND